MSYDTKLPTMMPVCEFYSSKIMIREAGFAVQNMPDSMYHKE